MHHWIYENLFVFVLASFSGFDLVKRALVRVRTGIMNFPLKCYLKIVSGLSRGDTQVLAACSKKGTTTNSFFMDLQ